MSMERLQRLYWDLHRIVLEWIYETSGIERILV